MRKIEIIDTPEGPSRICRKCSLIKPISEFYLTSRGRPGSYCKKCSSMICVENQRRNPEAARERRRKFVEKNRAMYERLCVNARMLHRYGITIDEYERMFNECGGACEICGDRPAERLCVDHCHGTGAVRGLLCKSCNLAIGHMRDDATRLGSAIEYLRSKSPKC